MTVKDTAAAIGIDLAVAAKHRVAVRNGAAAEDFTVAATLDGMETLTERLRPYAPALVVGEPTAMSWLAVGHAVRAAGCALSLVPARHTSRLRGAIAGKNKTDVIDAEMLAGCAGVFDLTPSVLPSAGQLALRRAVRRRHAAVVDAHGAECRLWALAAWAFPDVWRACAGSHHVAQPLLRRWPHLQRLAAAHVTSIADVCRGRLRGDRDPRRRAERIRHAARGWADFWHGRVDLDALAWEVTELVGDIAAADDREARAAGQAARVWHDRWGDDPLLMSVPGVGSTVAPIVRAWLGEATQFDTAKQAAAYVGLNPSNWESGLMASPSRPITKEGPPELRLAFYQAANVARRQDPELAACYWRLMVERGHNHIKANCAVARKPVTRVWATLTRGQPYAYRDLDGTRIDAPQAAEIAGRWAVPDDVRRRSRARTAAYKRGRLTS
jgi:transposase